MKSSSRYIAGMILTALFTLGCSEEPETLSSTTPSVDAGLEDGVQKNTPLYLKVGTQWESSSENAGFERMGNCSFVSTAPAGSSMNCVVTIPEAQLYYSKVQFSIGTTDPVRCPIIHFTPYYYVRSNQAGYLPPDADETIDCSSLAEAKCFGGSAPSLVPEFPKSNSLYFLTMVTPITSYTLGSGNKLRWYGPSHVNYLVTNDLTDRATAIPGKPKEYVGGTGNWQDHNISCSNFWGETLYNIRLIVRDEDQDEQHSGPLDDFPDWD